MKTIVLKSTHPLIVPILRGEKPEGVSIIGNSPTANRNIDFNTTVNTEINVEITINLGVVAAGAFCAWLHRMLSRTKGSHYLGPERKGLPKEERAAIELIEAEIQRENSKD